METIPPKRQVIRYPVPMENQEWAANRSRVVVLGVDPGLASGGVAVLIRETPQARLRCAELAYLKTEKAAKKARTNLRVTVDDFRRNKELFNKFEQLREKYQPYAVGVEAYTTKGPIGGGQASKTMGVYMGIVWWAWSRGLFAAAFLPADLKKRFCGKQSASKEEVEHALYREVDQFEAMMRKVPKGMREHVADAVGHGVLILEEVQRTKEMLGLA